MFASRRRVLAALLLACAAHAHAATPKAGVQAPGYYRTAVGDFEVTALSDGTHPFPPFDRGVSIVRCLHCISQ